MFLTVAGSRWAVYDEARTPHRVIDEVDLRAAQIVNRHFVDHDFHTVGFECCIHVANIIIESHPKIDAAATPAGYVHT